MKKKIFSVKEHYDFQDIKGIPLASAEANILQMPPKFTVVDTHDSELMHLQGKMFSIRSEFSIYDNQGFQLGTIHRKIAKLFGEEFWIEKNGAEFIRIYGDFTEHEYRFEVNGSPVVSVHKKWVSLRDEIGISFTGPVDHRVVLGAVIVIEHIEVTERQSNSS